MRLERASRAGDVEKYDIDNLAGSNGHRVRGVIVSVVSESGVVVDVESAFVCLNQVWHGRHVLSVLSSHISTYIKLSTTPTLTIYPCVCQNVF